MKALVRARLILPATLAAMAMLFAATAVAQQPGAAHRGSAAETREGAPREVSANREANQAALPADSVTDQTVELPGHVLRFKATAGSLPLLNAETRAVQAEIAYTAYTVESETPRPVTFVFNGGPGASSAYLQLGALGPWRLDISKPLASDTPDLLPNAETWLDFTDLVFVDPVGTGYSRFVDKSEAVRRQFWSVRGDREALSVFVRKWVEKFNRQSSPKFIAGESYGGFRAVKVARELHDDQGVGISGIVMVSPALDMSFVYPQRHAPWGYAIRLPSMAAAAMELARPGAVFDRDALRDVETYAAGDYLTDLIRGERDPEAIARISGNVARFTGLDPALVRRLAGRVDSATFRREVFRGRGLVGSAYDATITAFDPNPNAERTDFEDPMLHAMGPPLTAAMTALYQQRLNWRVDDRYRLLAGEVSGAWNWGNGAAPPQAIDDLRHLLAEDSRFRVLVTHGATDLVTPYFATQIAFNQLPAFGSADRLRLVVYSGGHMYYNRTPSRRALRDDAADLFKTVLSGPKPG
jgi:carboxypeptidase C (cathepsin A)